MQQDYKSNGGMMCNEKWKLFIIAELTLEEQMYEVMDAIGYMQHIFKLNKLDGHNYIVICFFLISECHSYCRK